MFQKITHTDYPPTHRPLMLWDGDCAFCAYWIVHWQKITGEQVNYMTYQEGASLFPDIPRHHFREAVRLIDTGGNVYAGAQAAYRSFTYNERWPVLDDWYQQSALFAKASDRAYQFVADNRPSLYRLTKLAFGSNPHRPKPYWVAWLAGATALLWGLKKVSSKWR